MNSKYIDIDNPNIQNPEMEKVAFVHDIQTQLFLLYSRLIEDQACGVKILKALENDTRVQGLDGHMISNGTSASRFEIKTLAMWFLWAFHKYGYEVAELNLNKFLNSETVPIINTLWVLGIEVDEPIELKNGVRIISIDKMPDSRDKEQYLTYELGGGFVHRIPMPKAAITHMCNITKAKRDDDFSEAREKDKQFGDSSQILHDIALLLNAVDGVSCIPYFWTSYALPEMPLGMFGASGGGCSVHDIFGYKSSKLSANSTSEINELLSAFDTLSSDNKIRMRRVLSRLSQAKRRDQIEDKILDLGVALEMVLLDDNKKNEQLSLTFRLRGSWLIGSDHERRNVYNQLRDIYEYRCQVAHSGALCKNDPKKINTVRENFQEYTLLAEKIIRQLIYKNNLDWTKLILGATKEKS